MKRLAQDHTTKWGILALHALTQNRIQWSAFRDCLLPSREVNEYRQSMPAVYNWAFSSNIS